MNNKIKNTFRIGAMAVAGLLAFASCSDTWEEHYDTAAGLTYSGSTMGYILSQPNLSDFAEILKATGYDKELNASQVLTILVPENGTFDKQSYLDLISAGKKQQVIDRFIKNHVLRYNISLGAEKQSLALLNEKRVEIGSLADKTIDKANVIASNIACKNGVIQVLDNSLPYAANLFEQIEFEYEEYVARTGEEKVPSLYKFLKTFDADSLDESRSVSRGNDADGNTVYVDSVMIRYNRALANMGAYLYREDSLYWAILPSMDAYAERYNQLKSYFNYNISLNSDEHVRDSIQDYMANYYTMSDLFFNMNMNQHVEDSIFATSYNRLDWQYNVFYKPLESDGLFSKTTQEIECSNGKVFKMEELPYTIYNNVFKKITVEAEYSFYLETGSNWTNSSRTLFSTRSFNSDDVSGSGFMDVRPAGSSANTLFSYQIPNNLSGTYDIYVKMLPLTYLQDESVKILPSQFRVSLYERGDDGKIPENRATYTFRNPKDDSRNYSNSATEIDSVLIGSYTFKNCYLDTTPGVLLQFESYVPSNARDTYTREMLIDCIILVPHQEDEETEETND